MSGKRYFFFSLAPFLEREPPCALFHPGYGSTMRDSVMAVSRSFLAPCNAARGWPHQSLDEGEG
jgi:hypothetical protein